MTRVTGIVKLIKNMMQMEAQQISSFLISATRNSFTEECWSLEIRTSMKIFVNILKDSQFNIYLRYIAAGFRKI
jgi:hypothetical protein